MTRNIECYTTEELVQELSRRSIVTLAVSLTVGEGNAEHWISSAKGTEYGLAGTLLAKAAQKEKGGG